MSLLDYTSSLWLSVINIIITFYWQFRLLGYSNYESYVTWYDVPWSMHFHILLMQVAMTLLLIQIIGQLCLPARIHRRLGYIIYILFVVNIPLSLRLAYLLLLRRHWWHSFVQLTAMLVIHVQMRRVLQAAVSHRYKYHVDQVWRLVSLVNGAAGSRLMGLGYKYILGFDDEMSYTLGLTTMFCLFLMPQVIEITKSYIRKRNSN
jgi:hypothetical protein